MADVLSLIDPVELTEYARAARDEFNERVSAFDSVMPYRPVNDIRYAYDKGASAFLDEATYRAFDAESPIGARPSAARITGEILPISRKIPVSEYAQLRMQGADAVVQGIFDDAARLAQGIAARVHRAQAQLLETGKVTISENGLVTEYDSGRAGAHTVATLASGDQWSAATTADPIGDVIGWSELIYGATGMMPTVLFVSPARMAELQVANSVRSALYGTTAPTRLSRDAVSDAFASLAGVRVEVYQAPAGQTATLDAKKVVLAVDNVNVGATLYGTPVEASEPEYAGLGVKPGIVAGSWKEHDPVVPWVKAVGLALPILALPDATLSAQVVA